MIPSLDRATTRHRRSPTPATVCTSMTWGIASSRSTTSENRPWVTSMVVNPVTTNPRAAGSTSGPKPVITPRRSNRSSRA